MGQQLTIAPSVMEQAGWTSKDVQIGGGHWDMSPSDNYGEEPVWVPPQFVRVWNHPEHGEVTAYAVAGGDFFADANEWGGNRPLFEKLGLFNLPHYLG